MGWFWSRECVAGGLFSGSGLVLCGAVSVGGMARGSTLSNPSGVLSRLLLSSSLTSRFSSPSIMGIF